MSKMHYFALATFPILLAFFACTNSDNVAGGVSEETNTIAGILVDVKGSPVKSALISARSIDSDTFVTNALTDDAGTFKLDVKNHKTYGVSAIVDSLAYYEVISVEEKDISLKAELEQTNSFVSNIVLSEETVAKNVQVAIPGSPWFAQTDELGNFELKNIPYGKMIFAMYNPDATQFEDAYYVLDVSMQGSFAYGPFSKNFAQENFNKISLEKSKAKAKSLVIPSSEENGLRSWWTMNAKSEVNSSIEKISDARSWTDGLLLYGKPALELGMKENALHLNGANQFGVVENDNQLFDNAKSFTVESWINLDSILSKDLSYRLNVIGKIGFGNTLDQNVFSIAVINGECDTEIPALAFFIADGKDNLTCEDAVIANSKIEMKKWLYVVATWNGKIASLFVNGISVGNKETSFEKINSSPESIFFGKEALKLMLDDVRISVNSLSEADVFYRYYKKGGEL